MISSALEGQTFGKYRILEPLGRGGMARVYRAFHPQLNRYVAVKVLRSDLVEEGEFLARFRREAQAVAALRHTNIIQVFDFDVQDDVYYIVMELLEGDTLKVRLNDYRVRGEKMPGGEVIRVLLDVLSGLAYAHSEGMIHRDIKPANILLTKRGEAVLADFGIAQIVGGTRHTVSGALMGTLNYMAPEQGMSGNCDARSDIYSLGIVFYEMLTQTTPFDADTPLAILMKHLNEPLPILHEIDQSIPRPFERVVLKSLAKAPEDRYQSAAEMAEALRLAAAEAGIQVPTRISLPMSFTAPGAPAESVAVFSGSARERIVEADFAADDTSSSLPQPATPPAADAAVRTATVPVEFPATQPVPVDPAQLPTWNGVAKTLFGSCREMMVHPKNRRSQCGSDLFNQAWEDVKWLCLSEFSMISDEKPPQGKFGPALFNAAALFLIFNLVMLLFAGIISNYDVVWGRGWPWELLLATAGLCTLMRAKNAVWMLMPVGILGGFGLFFGFISISGNWNVMNALWPVLPLLVIGVVWGTVMISGRGQRSRWLARALAGFIRTVSIALIFALVGLAVIF